MGGARASRPFEVSPENLLVPGADSVDRAGGNSVDPHPMAHEGGAPGGVLVDGTLEEDDPGTWETHPLGGEPEAEGKGDRSRGRMRGGSRRAP